MGDINLSDPAFKPENENPQRRTVRATRVPPTERSEKLVRVTCITELKPWIIIREEGQPEFLRPMDHGEIAVTPEWVADILVSNKHAVRV